LGGDRPDIHKLFEQFLINGDRLFQFAFDFFELNSPVVKDFGFFGALGEGRDGQGGQGDDRQKDEKAFHGMTSFVEFLLISLTLGHLNDSAPDVKRCQQYVKKRKTASLPEEAVSR
jgi:hypothetical protein